MSTTHLHSSTDAQSGQCPLPSLAQHQQHQQTRGEEEDVHFYRHCQAEGGSQLIGCGSLRLRDGIPVDKAAQAPSVMNEEVNSRIEQQHRQRVIEQPQEENGVDTVGSAAQESQDVWRQLQRLRRGERLRVTGSNTSTHTRGRP